MMRLFVSLLFLAASVFAAERPNVVVFLVDDMGCMDTSVPFLEKKHPLNELYRTPNMERLAGQGIRFGTFYAMSVCSPTRVSIMTGQTSARHTTTQFIKPETKNTGDHGPEAWNWKGIRKGQVTLPALLRDNGYRTIHAGKAHFGPIDSFGSDPAKFGFDVNIAGCAFGAPGSYLGTKKFGHGIRNSRRAVPGLEQYHGKDIHLTEATTIEFNKALSQAVGDKKPFFGYLSHYAVHSPFELDQRFAKNYPDAPGKMKAFLTMVEGMDKSLGDVLDQLEKLGVADNTLVFFLGDNGTDAPNGGIHEVACAAPLRGKKGTHYEGGMRVPFIAAWAKRNEESKVQKAWPISANSRSTAIGSVYDLFPTILDLTETPHPADHPVDGRNLKSFLTGEVADGDHSFLMHFPHKHRSSYFTVYRTREMGETDGKDWKLIRHDQPAKDEPRYELFDLDSDPYESTNLAEKNVDKLKAMEAAMEAEMERVGAQRVQK